MTYPNYGPVRGLTAKFTNPTTVELTWLSPMGPDGNPAVADYEITANRGTDAPGAQGAGYPAYVAKGPTPAGSFTVNGLEGGAEYTFCVRAQAAGADKLSGPWAVVRVNEVAPIGLQVAENAETYIGHVYVYGGPSNVNGGWDCSAFASWVLGHNFGHAIPDDSGDGGSSSWASQTASGSEHGPTAAEYKSWGGASNISLSEVQPGDLLCWDTHVGFVSSDGQHMMSAYDTADGTILTAITAGPTGETLQPRRINGF